MSEKNRGASSAGRPEAVASETARAAVADTGPTDDTTKDDTPTSDTSVCADCGSSEVIYVTEDPATESKGYCANDLPANVTPKMVEEQQGRS